MAVHLNGGGPDGLLTLQDLPNAGTKRWVIRRKAQVVAAVQEGLMPLELACSQYLLSQEEFLTWQDAIQHHGFEGLRATRLNKYRQPRHRSVDSPWPNTGPPRSNAG
jgi:hypothetical protein